MPVYEYECPLCGYHEEVVCKIADRPAAINCAREDGYCPGQMRQVITAPAIQCDDLVNCAWGREFAASRPEARTNRRTGKKKYEAIQTRTELNRYMKEKHLRPAKLDNISEV